MQVKQAFKLKGINASPREFNLACEHGVVLKGGVIGDLSILDLHGQS